MLIASISAQLCDLPAFHMFISNFSSPFVRVSRLATCSPYATALHMRVAQQMLMHLQIRNHAAAALSNLGQRCLYGELWQPAVQAIADAFINLQKSENGDDRSINAGMSRLPPL